MNKKNETIRKVFVGLMFLCIMIIPFVPFLNIRLFGFSAELSEFVLIILLIILMVTTYRVYEKDLKRNKLYQHELEERLRETFKYIGSVNLQIEEMKKVFSNAIKYPENKKELHALFINMSERILGIVNVDWVMLRIADIDSHTTLHEHFIVRGNKQIDRVKLDNKCLLDGLCLVDGQTVIQSAQENFNIKAFCILPNKVTKDQEFMIKSVINQLEMMFVIFNSLYYKNRTK